MAEALTTRPLDVALLLLIVSAGLFLRLHQIGGEGLWIDEAFSLWLANRPLSEMVHWVSQVDHHPPLYYALLHGWTAILGDGEAMARSLSTFFGVLTLPLMYLIGRRLAGPRVGLLSALLLALSPFHVRFGQEARMYSLLTLLAAAAMVFFLGLLAQWERASRRDRARSSGADERVEASRRNWTRWLPWLGYVGCTGAMLWTHNTAVFFPVATNLAVLGKGVMRRRAAGRSDERRVLLFGPQRNGAAWLRRWLGAQAGIFLLWLPWIPSLVSQVSDVLDRFWLPAPTVGTVLSVVGAFLCDVPSWPFLASVIVDVALGGLALMGLRALHRRSRHAALLVALFATPIAGQWLVSLWRPILYARTLVWASLPLYVMVATGVLSVRHLAPSRRAGRGVVLAVLAVVVAIQAAARGGTHTGREKESWDEAAALVADRIRPGDLVLFNDAWGQIPFDYYFRQLRDGQTPPAVVERGLPVDLFDRGVLEPEMREEDLPRLRELVSGRQRVWLVTSHAWYTDPEGLIPRALATALDRRQHWTFEGLEVRLYLETDSSASIATVAPASWQMAPSPHVSAAGHGWR